MLRISSLATANGPANDIAMNFVLAAGIPCGWAFAITNLASDCKRAALVHSGCQLEGGPCFVEISWTMHDLYNMYMYAQKSAQPKANDRVHSHVDHEFTMLFNAPMLPGLCCLHRGTVQEQNESNQQGEGVDKSLEFPNMVVLNAVGRKRAQTQVSRGAQKGAKKRFCAKKIKQPGLKQPG